MSYDKLTAREAWTRATKSQEANWAKTSSRLDESPVPVRIKAAFQIDPSQKVFCIGSCFARNIEEHLFYRGIPVLSKRIITPKAEWPLRPNGIVNKYNAHAMLQELRWQIIPPKDTEAFLAESDTGCWDLHLSPYQVPLTRERVLERRAYLMQDYFSRLKMTDTVILTLGLNEVWRDTIHDVWLNAAPNYYKVRRQPDRYEFVITDVADNLAALDEFRALLKRLNPGVRLVVTVSPVAMDTTFSGDDVFIANHRSKCTLRAAAESFCRKHEDVAYFPSFEMVTLANPAVAYEPDRRHVEDKIVGQVTGAFLQAYAGDSRPLDPHYIEGYYLAANPDIEERVRSGEFESGLEHWLSEGRAAGRPLA